MLPFTRRFLREYMPGKGKYYFWGLLFLVLTILVTTAIPRSIHAAIELLDGTNGSLTDAEGKRMQGIGWKIAAMGLSLVLFRTLSRVIIFIPGRVAEAEVRQDFFEAATKLSSEDMVNLSTGDLVSRATNDIGAVRVLLSMGVLHITNSIMMTLFCGWHMVRIDGKLTLICLLLVPVITQVMRVLSKMAWERIRTATESLGVLTNTIRELLRAHTLLGIYPVFDRVFSRFQKDNELYGKHQERAAALRVVAFNLSATMAGVAVFVALYVAGPWVIEGRMALADFIEFTIYLGLIQEPLRASGFLISIFQRGEICLARNYEIRELAASREAAESAKPVATREAFDSFADLSKPFLEVRDLRWQYPVVHGDKKSLEPFILDVDELTLEAGKSYGIFGATGAGKTTLLQLLTGVIPTPAGTCTLHGMDLAQISQDLVYRQYAVVAQDNRHFDKTIQYNLDLVRMNQEFEDGWPAPATDFDTAVEVSQIGPEIAGFQEGYETLIGEDGVRLSGGQRQRLALFRALLKPRRALILDDIVSAVDHETESRLLRELFAAVRNETLVIVSHRISALKPCDCIFVLEAGRIVDRGSHEELLVRHAGYRQTNEYQVLEQQVEAYADGI